MTQTTTPIAASSAAAQTAAPPPPLILHHNNFGFLRFAMAVGVIISHAYPLLLGANTSEPLAEFMHKQSSIGDLCVIGFFIVSGFLVTGSWERSRTLFDFLIKRALRIFPGLAVALLVCILVVAPLGGADFPEYLSQAATWKVLSIITMRSVVPVDFMPSVFNHLPYRDLIGTTWTLRFDFGCYLLVLALGVCQVFKRPKMATAVMAALLLLSLAASHYAEAHRSALGGTVVTAPHLIVCFSAGSLAYLLRDKIPHSRWIALACVGVLILCRAHFLLDVLPFAGTYLLLHFAFSKSVRFAHFGGKLDLSFGLCLYGWPVEQLLVYHFAPHLTPLTLLAAALPLSAALAWLSWTFVERPFLRLKTQMPRRTEPRLAPPPAT